MFKPVVPVLSLLLLAGPAFAADTPADQSGAPVAKSTAKKHHGHHSSKKHKSTASSSDSSTPHK